MPAGVDDGVHLLVEADGAFSVLACRGQIRAGDGRGDGWTEGRAGSRDCKEKKEDKEDNSDRSDDKFHHADAVKRPERTSLISLTLSFSVCLPRSPELEQMNTSLL